MDSVDLQLLRKRIAQKRTHQSIRPLYGDHAWVKDLDIVNELGGHTGCVNALSWSASGRLLASGSDDTYLNIWEYHPDGQTKSFTLNTSVATGHTANIFSVKFMPHSNDRTVVTCAGDSEVRVFDLEYGGATAATGATESTRSRRFNNFFTTCKWLTDANTNARVYRSHADRAKRIVTESSPHIFLSCSEDGEVRQWDLRQPSSAYPPPRDARNYGFRRRAQLEPPGDVPPALISYKSYGLDLNTISCSKSQPHYIALGGAHQHCFLHDRRMLGRDLAAEQGKVGGRKPSAGSAADEVMHEATRCVRRFAPNGKRRMRPGDHGHITACKISDARPNELISSWSGDHVYSFDIVKSPDARDKENEEDEKYRIAVLTNRADRKRKRTKTKTSSTSNADGAQEGRRLRKVSDGQAEDGSTALRLRHGNGETEYMSILEDDAESSLLAAHDNLLSEAQKQSERIARALVELRKTIFDFSTVLAGEGGQPEQPEGFVYNTRPYTKALGQASALLPDMEEVMRQWSYPRTTDPDEITLQNTLRRNRQASWRFVQAAGCLSKTLGGRILTSSSSEDPRLPHFETIKLATHEEQRIDDNSRFCYDFIKAITLWLNGGKEAVLAGFKRPPDQRGATERFPFGGSLDIANVGKSLREYLLPLASEDKPVIDLGRNQFERDEIRQIFMDQKLAVNAFTRAVDQIEELRMHYGPTESSNEGSDPSRRTIMDKGAAARFWGEKVGRALLMDAAHGVTFNFVNRAFGSLKVHVSAEDEVLDRLMDEVLAEHEASVEPSATSTFEGESSGATTSSAPPPRVTVEEAPDETDTLTSSFVQEGVEEEESDDEDDDENVAEDSDDPGSDDDDDDEDDEAAHLIFSHRRRGIAGPLSTQRASVNEDVAYSSHTKTYKGHCNTRTVKDVNYYGLDDEYVVSGSDDGHFFVWDRKTTEIVSVFEGDGEVVNVIQGHPYEPMIACSGIDSTVKIFGQGGDNRERYNARHGVDIANPGNARHSSLGFGMRRRRRAQAEDDNEDGTDADREEAIMQVSVDDEDERAVVKGGLRSRRVPMDKVYEIMSQNNAERRRGVGDAFMTQDMLATLAMAIRNGDLQGIEGQALGGTGGTIVIDENCAIM